jgi:hypothetical protein
MSENGIGFANALPHLLKIDPVIPTQTFIFNEINTQIKRSRKNYKKFLWSPKTVYFQSTKGFDEATQIYIKKIQTKYRNWLKPGILQMASDKSAVTQ